MRTPKTGGELILNLNLHLIVNFNDSTGTLSNDVRLLDTHESSPGVQQDSDFHPHVGECFATIQVWYNSIVPIVLLLQALREKIKSDQ